MKELTMEETIRLIDAFCGLTQEMLFAACGETVTPEDIELAIKEENQI